MDQQPLDTVGHWTLERELWRARTGVAHLADADEAQAAIKVFRSDLDDGWARFQRESELLQQLKHQSLVQCQGTRLDDDPPHLVLDVVKGETMRSRLSRGPLPVQEALQYARELAELLAYLHAKGAWHRDLRPDGIVLAESGGCIVVEFGLAKVAGADRLTKPGKRLGDVYYAPPEWLTPHRQDPLWDIYSLGVVLHECLTGTLPFRVAGTQAIAVLLQVTQIKRTMKHIDPGPGFPDGVRDLVRRLTATDPNQRLKTARQAASILADLLRDLDAHEVSSTPRPLEPVEPISAHPAIEEVAVSLSGMRGPQDASAIVAEVEAVLAATQADLLAQVELEPPADQPLDTVDAPAPATTAEGGAAPSGRSARRWALAGAAVVIGVVLLSTAVLAVVVLGVVVAVLWI